MKREIENFSKPKDEESRSFTATEKQPMIIHTYRSDIKAVSTPTKLLGKGPNQSAYYEGKKAPPEKIPFYEREAGSHKIVKPIDLDE